MQSNTIKTIRTWNSLSRTITDMRALPPMISHLVTSGDFTTQGNYVTGITEFMCTAQIMPLRFLDEDEAGRTADEIAAIDYAVNKGAKIINASFGSNNCSVTERAAIAAANTAGVLFVAAAG